MPLAPWIVRKADFASLMGWSRPYVSKLIKEDRLGLGLRSDQRIDVEAACRAMGLPLPQRSVHPQATMLADDSSSSAGIGAPAQPPAMQDGEPGDALSPVGADGASDELLAYRIRIQSAAAQRAEMALEEARGTLVDRAAVDAEVEALARKFRDRMLKVPEGIASALVDLTDEAAIEALLVEAIETALSAVSAEGDDAA